jgi:hypothetical protein
MAAEAMGGWGEKEANSGFLKVFAAAFNHAA